MDFGDFLRSAEHNAMAGEQTKRELLDIVLMKASEAHSIIPYPKIARSHDDQGRRICLTDWTPGRFDDKRVCAEITFYEEDRDGFNHCTEYVFTQEPDGLGLAKYEGTSSPPPKRATKGTIERLLEDEERREFVANVDEYLDGLSEQDRARLQKDIEEGIAREKQQEEDAKTLADELGTSLVFESEALDLLGMIRSINWVGDTGR